MSVIELKVPTIGESVTEVTLSKWLIADGEYVDIDTPICEFESDKATLEFPAEAAGKITWVAAEGDDLAIGAVVAKLDTSVTAGKENSDPLPGPPMRRPAPTPPLTKKETETKKENTTSAGELLEMKVPTIGESVTEVTLAKWLVANGEQVKIDEPICEFESDKATLELPAEASGKLIWVAAEGDDLAIGALVAKIDTSSVAETTSSTSTSESKSTVAATTTQEAATKSTTASYASGHPSPAAAKILKENGVATSNVEGSGRDGRITKADAQQAITNAKTSPTVGVISNENSTATPTSSSNGFSRDTRVEKMSRMRRTISKRLVSVTQNTAMLTTFNEVDLTAVMAMRKKYQELFVAKYGVKLGFMSIFAKACAKALMEFPSVNSHIGEDEKSLIYHDFVDISFAISTDTGLVVPPIRNIESLKFHEIELKLKELAGKARSGKLTIDEMQGGTFAITNGGIFGSMMSTPILNAPQSAILGMHNIIQRPIAVDGEVQIRPMMYLALSYDHRVIDGKSSVTFLVKVKNLLEDPTTLLLDL